MKNPRRKVEKLVSHIHGVISPLGYELIAVLPIEILVIYLKSFFLQGVPHRFAYPENHVQDEVPIVMADAYDAIVLVLVLIQLVDMVFTLQDGPLAIHVIKVIFNHAQELHCWAVLLHLFLF